METGVTCAQSTVITVIRAATLTIRRSRYIAMFKFGSKGPLKMVNLSLGKRRPPWRCGSRLRCGVGGIGLTGGGIGVSEDNDWNEQPAAKTRQGIVRMRACNEICSR
jgi:hypothetical protein